MLRLIRSIARCPFSLARIVGTTPDGKVIYRAIGAKCFPFPKTGDKELTASNPRNFEVFDSLHFLATVTQHIPNTAQVYNSETVVRNEPLVHLTQQNRR